MNAKHISRRAQAGLTLVEILIAVLIISIGLLGVAGLHAYSLRNNYDALMRSHASALAADITDRMRANRTAALGGDYNMSYSDGAPDVDDDSPISVIDQDEWLAALERALPGGDGEIDVDAGTQLATIRIRWGERGNDLDPEDLMEFVTETEI